MTSERSKRRDFLSLIFIAKSISKKLLIKISLEPKKKIFHVKIRIFRLKDVFRTSYKTNQCYFQNGLPIAVFSLSP